MVSLISFAIFFKDLEDQQSRITRAATEVAALIQKFNSAITTENKASYRGV